MALKAALDDPAAGRPDKHTFSPISDEAQNLLKTYSHIPSDEISRHILDVRRDAFQRIPFDALAQVRFSTYCLPSMPAYRRVLDLLRKGGRFLDAGCSIGQELRHLVHQERIHPRQLYGFDVDRRLIDLGFRYFNDKSVLANQFIVADVLENDDDDALRNLDQKLEVIFASSLLHLWDWDRQLQAASRLAVLTKPKPGCIILGKQLGSKNADHASSSPRRRDSAPAFLHDPESMHRLWAAVTDLTGIRFCVQAAFVDEDDSDGDGNGDSGGSGSDFATLTFCATRI